MSLNPDLPWLLLYYSDRVIIWIEEKSVVLATLSRYQCGVTSLRVGNMNTWYGRKYEVSMLCNLESIKIVWQTSVERTAVKRA